MAKRITAAESKAQEILEFQGVATAPIPVEAVARNLGAIVVYEAMESDLSGMLQRQADKPVIGVNSFHGTARQRFTIAHECGHLVLHSKDLFIDVGVRRRDGTSSLGTDQEEIDANRFAAGLLMPRDLVRAHVTQLLTKKPEISVDDLVTRLARTFDVSSQAMEIRLTDLGILSFR